LDRQLQLLAAVLTAPGWRADGWQTMLAASAQMERAREADPDAVFARDAPALLHSGDARWLADTAEQRAKWTPAGARAFLEPILKAAPLEVVLVGDVDAEAAIAAVGRTFGALAPRADAAEPPDLRKVSLPPPTKAPIVLRHAGPANRAKADVSWPAT